MSVKKKSCKRRRRTTTTAVSVYRKCYAIRNKKKKKKKKKKIYCKPPISHSLPPFYRPMVMMKIEVRYTYLLYTTTTKTIITTLATYYIQIKTYILTSRYIPTIYIYNKKYIEKLKQN